MSQPQLEVLAYQKSSIFFFLLVAYVLLAKYTHIRTADKYVLDSITDQHVSAASLSHINELDNMVNNWSLQYHSISIDSKYTSLQYLVYNDLHDLHLNIV